MEKKLIEQYSRHILLPEIGIERQAALQNKSVLIIGLGGLGCIQAIYLAAAGVGKIGLVDGDVVERNNLQRQILYSEKDLSKSKVTVAEKYLLDLNSNVEIEVYDEFISPDNANKILKGFDIIVDSTDNFSTHYLINDACVLLNKNHIFGSIFRFEGQVSFFTKKSGPCYRCLYPKPAQAGEVLDCEAGGVFNHIPGIIGLIQSTEALKYLLGIKPSLTSKLLVFDGLTMEFQKYKYEKSTTCIVCGNNAEIKNLINYESLCGICDIVLDAADEISPEELNRRMRKKESFRLIDVRENEEFMLTRLPGAVLIPFNRLHDSLNQIGYDEDIIVYCRSGIRSARAILLLKEKGYKKVKNLTGGIKKFTQVIDPSLINY